MQINPAAKHRHGLGSNRAQKKSRTEANVDSNREGGKPAKRALPTVPKAVDADRLASDWLDKGWHQSTTARGFCDGEPQRQHPMAAFNNFLEASGALIDGREYGKNDSEKNVCSAPQSRQRDGFHSLQAVCTGLGHCLLPNDVRDYRNQAHSTIATASAKVSSAGIREQEMARFPRLQGADVGLPHTKRPMTVENNKLLRSTSMKGGQRGEIDAALNVSATTQAKESLATSKRLRWRALTEEPASYDLYDNTFDLLLCSKGYPGLTTGQWCSGDRHQTDSAFYTGLRSVESTTRITNSYDPDHHLDTQVAANVATPWASDSAVPPPAGVFRLSHGGTGFVHYGYSWDIRAAKIEHMRQRLGTGTESEVFSRSTNDSRWCRFSNGGLSEIARQEHKKLEAQGIAHGVRSDCLRFEIVREIPLPPRFCAREFDMAMSEACTQERLKRLHLLLILVARRYRLRHCAVAFHQLRAECRREAEDERDAAAAEILRTWRGYRGRMSATNQRTISKNMKIQTDAESVRAIVAVWGQARYRGKIGRRRVTELKENVSNERVENDRIGAAVTIQVTWRSSQRQRAAAAAALLTAAENQKKKDPSRQTRGSRAPDKGSTVSAAAVSSARRAVIAVTPSEVWAARVLGTSDEASLSFASDWIPPELQDLRRGERRRVSEDLAVLVTRRDGDEERKSRRPSSSRGIRNRGHLRAADADAGIQSSCHRSSGNSRRHREPTSGSSAPSTCPTLGQVSRMSGEDVEKLSPATASPDHFGAGSITDGGGGMESPMRDSSRLVLEGGPGFEAATAVQAAWRGFVVRLAVWKRRRATAALRRKREGKWRQQRGVVGKQVSVGWDERRALEEVSDMFADEHGLGRSACVDIQRVWRGALGRKRAQTTLKHRRERLAACITIQRTIARGEAGRHRARHFAAVRDKRIAAATLLTRQGRRFVGRIAKRRLFRQRAAITIQSAVRRRAGRLLARDVRLQRGCHIAARKIQRVARRWIARREDLQRWVLRKWGACASCCSRKPEVFFAGTEQELCLGCYQRTIKALDNRRLTAVVSNEVVLVPLHRKRQRAATLTQRAWLQFQLRAATKYGSCEACPRLAAGSGQRGRHSRPRAARAVCIAGCDRGRDMRFCHRCCAITHTLRATSGHEIRGVDRYGAEMAATTVLCGALWRYLFKLRFWRIFARHRHTLLSSATTIQSQWRCYRCRSVFNALRRAFFFAEAAGAAVEQYWLVGIYREVIMADVAGFLAYNVHGNPPGMHPPPSGHLSLWATGVTATIRRRAAEAIQRRWRDRVMRIVAWAKADFARQEMMMRERMRAVAEEHAAIDIQRAWRGLCGRYTARKRAITIAFARRAAEGYTSPKRFAEANLRAFNFHGGYLGHAGIDARSLLAAAGDVPGSTVLSSAFGEAEGPPLLPPAPPPVEKMSRPTRRGERSEGVLRVRLVEHDFVAGGDIDWNGNGTKGCGRGDGRGGVGGGIPAAIGGIAEVDIRVRLIRKRTEIEGTRDEDFGATTGTDKKKGEDGPMIRLHRKRGELFEEGACRRRKRRRVIDHRPPATLKLELVSVQVDSQGVRHPGSITRSRGSDDDRGQNDNVFFCEVKWCGEVVGTTHAPPAGLPIPRWQGQVCYLPLSAAGCGVAASSQDEEGDHETSHGVNRPVEKRWKGIHEEGRRDRPPLLTVTLNRLVAAPPGDRRLGWDHRQNGKAWENGERRDHGGKVRSVEAVDPWRAFLWGLTEPKPIGRAVLEAGDVLSMLGSQQVINLCSFRSMGDSDENSRSPAMHRAESEEDSTRRHGEWRLRLLLSLEDRERTRTRLLVTVVLADIMTGILDEIPSKVARIELRVLGLRQLTKHPSSSFPPRHRKSHCSQDFATEKTFLATGGMPPIVVTIEWNSDRAGVVAIPSAQGLDQTPDAANQASWHTIFRPLPYRGSIVDGSPDDGTGAFGSSYGGHGLVMLPLYVPSVMKTPENRADIRTYSDNLSVLDKTDANCSCHRGNDEDGGGRSHCLRVTIAADVGRAVPDCRSEQQCSDGSSQTTTHIREFAEATYFERDLVRERWTEIIAPFTCSFAKNDADLKLGNLSRRERRKRRYRRQKGLTESAPSSFGVVMWARSAGLNPETFRPPLWLRRRDFAERAVGRIIAAATAAVAQPRVEVTLLGLRGAIDSLLSRPIQPEDFPIERADKIWSSSAAMISSPRRPSPRHLSSAEATSIRTGGDGVRLEQSNEEILCETFWNGNLVHNLRLTRCNACPFPELPSPPTTGSLTESQFPATRAVRNADETKFGHDDGNSGAVDLRSSIDIQSGYGVTGRGADEDVNNPFTSKNRLGTSSESNSDPRTQFSSSDPGDGMSASRIRENVADWVNPGGVSWQVDSRRDNGHISRDVAEPSPAPPPSAGAANAADRPRKGGEELFPGLLRSKENTRHGKPTLLAWEPAKGETYGRRPFSFFLPACCSDGGVEHNSECGSSDAGSRDGVVESPVKGVLRMVFWDTHGQDKAVGTRSRNMERTLIGCACLADDELLLKPPGDSVELSLFGSAGLDRSDRWAMDREAHRKFEAYRVLGASVSATIRHFDVPRDTICRLRCPSPFLEVEVIDAHRLSKASGYLSTNPYVVLTMNGEPFARSMTARRTTAPVWSSDTFRVKMPPPTQAWHLAAADYFRGYSGEPCNLGAKVYSQVGIGDTEASAHCTRTNGFAQGRGADDVLLGEGTLPFSLLKRLPFHYLPLRLSSPGSLPEVSPAASGAACATATAGHTNTVLTGSRSIYHGVVCDGDFGLLGIGLTMAFAAPVIPDLPMEPGDPDEARVARGSRVSAETTANRNDRIGSRTGAESGILLKVYDAEKLTQFGRPGKNLSAYCVVLVGGVEIGRTRTVRNTPEPMWGAEFRLTNRPRRDESHAHTGSESKTKSNSNAPSSSSKNPPSGEEKSPISACLEVWDDDAAGDRALLGTATIPPDLLSELSATETRDRITTDHNGEGSGRGGKNDSSDPVFASTRGRVGCGPCFLTMDLVVRTAADEPIKQGESSANRASTGVLSVSVERFSEIMIGRKDEGDRGGNSCGDDRVSSDEEACLEMSTRKGSSAGGAVKLSKMTMESESSLQRNCSAVVNSLARTTRGAMAQLDEARAILHRSGARSGTAGDDPRKIAERHVRACARESNRAEQAERRAASRPIKEFGQERLRRTTAISTKRSRWSRSIAVRRLKRNSRAKINRASTRSTGRRTAAAAATVKAEKQRKLRAEQNRRKRQSAVGAIEASTATIDNVIAVESAAAGPIAGRSVAESKNSSLSGQAMEEKKILTAGPTDVTHAGTAGRRENDLRVAPDTRESNELADQPRSALERILPPLPAARPEIFLRVMAVSGLEHSLSHGGSAVSVRVFWGREEVGRTADVSPTKAERATIKAGSIAVSKKEDPDRTATSTVGTASITSNEQNHRRHNTGKLGEATAATAASMTKFAASAAAAITAGGDPLSGTWQGETFRLPLPEDPSVCVRNDVERDAQEEIGAVVVAASENTDITNSVSDVHLRLEVWQGQHCHGQIELESTELLRMCKQVRNVEAVRSAEFTLHDPSRLPDYFPHFLAKPEAVLPYELALVPRECDGNNGDTPAQPARVAITLLSLEAGQEAAAEGHLAAAMDILRARRSLTTKSEAPGDEAIARRGVTEDDANQKPEDLIFKKTPGNTAETLVRVLNARRSPLSFQLETLLLRINSADFKRDESLGGSDLVVVVRKREILSSPVLPGQHPPHSDQTGQIGCSHAIGRDVHPTKTDARGQSQKEAEAKVIEETEELGRSAPFRVRSPTTMVSAAITVPASALLEDLPRSRGRRGGMMSMQELKSGSKAGTGNVSPLDLRVVEKQQKQQIVIELVHPRGVVERRGILDRLSTTKHATEASATGGVGNDQGELGKVFAHAYLEPEFLRRIIGSQRSVILFAPSERPGETEEIHHEAEEEEEEPMSRKCFARLEVAGHPVAVRSDLPRIRLEVLGCQNLKKADSSRRSDPCVLVFWDGVEVGRTCISCADPNPVFSPPNSTFRLTLSPVAPTVAEDLTASVQSHETHWQRYMPELRVEVWDMDRDTSSRQWNGDDFSGSISLRGPCGIVPVLRASMKTAQNEAGGVLLKLTDDDRRASWHGGGKNKARKGAHGFLSIRMVIENPTVETDEWEALMSTANAYRACERNTEMKAGWKPGLPVSFSASPVGRRLAVRCLDARGLPLGSDGYCRVFWNGRQVGRTPSASSLVGPGSCPTNGDTTVAPAWVCQRNPVWWAPSMVERDGGGHRRGLMSFDGDDAGAGADGAIIIPPFERPDGGDELIIEIFDASDQSNAVDVRKTKQKHAGNAESQSVKESANANGERNKAALQLSRDMVGPSLGSVTLCREYLLTLSRGRIDMPLTGTSSTIGSEVKGSLARSLSISLELLPREAEEETAMADPFSCSDSQQATGVTRSLQHDKDTSAAVSKSARGLDRCAVHGQAGGPRQKNGPKRWLKLLLRGARLLRGLDISGTSDPYCVVYFNRLWRAESTVCRSTLAPRWDQWVEIELVPAEAFALGCAEVRVEVWDKDAVGDDYLIGEALLYLHEDENGRIIVEDSGRAETKIHQREAGLDEDKGAPSQRRTTGTHRNLVNEHSLRLRPEGQEEAMTSQPSCGADSDEGSLIGTLSCVSLINTEQSWASEVTRMNLPWALGAQHGYSCLVVQVVSVVPSGIKQRQYHPPRDVTSPTCFAVVRWCGIEVGRTPCCRDLSAPTWQHQTFALWLAGTSATGQKESEAMVEVEIYCVDEKDAPSPRFANMVSLAEASSMGRYCLAGRFLRRPYPEYGTTYPLFPAEDAPTGVGNGSAPAPSQPSSNERRESPVLPLPSSSHSDWDDYHSNWASGQEVASSLGSVTLRIGGGDGDAGTVEGQEKREVAGCNNGAVGDEDAWDVKRRRKNPVNRRLRLWIRWVSLTGLVDSFISSAATGEVGRSRRSSAVTSGVQYITSRGRVGDDNTKAELEEDAQKKQQSTICETSVDSVRPLPTTQTKTVVDCRVTWCGKRLASFELCPCTGLPLTPGECLLPFLRGSAWRSHSLLLEVVATERVVGIESPSRSGGSAGDSKSSSGGDSRSSVTRSDSSSGSTDGPPAAAEINDAGGGDSNASDFAVVGGIGEEERQGKLLGAVFVDWQALKKLDERSYDFTTCLEEANPACGRRDDYLDVQCALCIPVHGSPRSKVTSTAMSSTDEVGRHGASPIRNGGRSENALAGGAKPTPSSPGDARRNHPAKRELHEKNTLDAKQKDTVPSLLAQRSAPVAWKIRPARLAMSLRVERLQTTRPSLPLRAPPQAPPGYAVCRLRLGIAGISVRASHPGFGRVSLARLIESTATVTVRWNGYDDGVGAFSAWRVPLVAPAGNGAVAGSGQNDLLLPVPKNNRRGLLLSLSVQRPNFRQVSQSTGGWIAKEVIDDNHHFSGVVNIGWDGLSCLPVNRTDFFVDAQDGLFMTNESGRRPSLAVTLELLAVLQTPRQPLKQAAASTLPVADASTSTVSRQSSAGIAGGYGSEECSSAGKSQTTAPSLFEESSSGVARQTTGIDIRINAQLEESPASVPHMLELTLAAARGPSTEYHSLVSNTLSSSTILIAPANTSATRGLGDFRNPCRTERLPYLRFAWPWDEKREGSWAGSFYRRRSLVSRRPWRPKHDHIWSNGITHWRTHEKYSSSRSSRRDKVHEATPGTESPGAVTIPLPLELSGLDGSVVSPGAELLRESPNDPGETSNGASLDLSRNVRAPRFLQRSPDVVLVEVFDMGPYSSLEHHAASIAQRVWRKGLEALAATKRSWAWHDECRRRNAAIILQVSYRGWKARQFAQLVRSDAAKRSVSAVVVQRAWRRKCVYARAEELRASVVRRVVEIDRLDKELARRNLESRRAGLSVIVALGAGLRGMDLSILGNPYCVILWNDDEVGRTSVQYGTRHPDWTSNEEQGGKAVGGGGDSGGGLANRTGFTLPFFVPESEKWGCEAWPPMSLEIRCYDYNLMGSPDLIGKVKLDADDILGIAEVATSTTVADDPRAVTYTSTLLTSLTWVKLTSDATDSKAPSPPQSSPSPAVPRRLPPGRNENGARNPFDTLGEIAIALTTTLPLPASVSEYSRYSGGDEEGSPSHAAARAAVRALLLSVQRSICSRDRGLWVVDASGLPKLDFLGKSDPYAKVFWDGREIGKTAVRRETLNPVWVDDPGAGTTERKQRSSKSKRKSKQGDTTMAPEDGNPFFWLEGSRSLNPRLRVELYDWDAVGSHGLLGGVELELEEVVELQRTTLGKVRMTSNTDQQMLVKTDFPLRSRRNKIGENGTVGLCLYLDLEQEKRGRAREQAKAARRQQAVDPAVAEVPRVREEMNRERLNAENVSLYKPESSLAKAPELSLQVLQQRQTHERQGEHQSRRPDDDKSFDRPVPSSFNRSTGEFTRECPGERESSNAITAQNLEPNARNDSDGTDDHRQHEHASELEEKCTVDAPSSRTQENDSNSPPSQRQTQPVVLGADVQAGNATGEPQIADCSCATEQKLSLWVAYWSEVDQAYYYFNQATQESSWEPPRNYPAVRTETRTEANDVNDTYTSERHNAETSLTAWKGRHASEVYNSHAVDGRRKSSASAAQGRALVVVGDDDGHEQKIPVTYVSRQGTGNSDGYPYFVNDRGNRVFCVPRKPT